MTVDFHDPRANPAVAATPYALSANLDSDITIGLLANGFPDSEAFLDEVDAALAQSLPHAKIHRYNKHGASVPASDSLMQEISEQCDVLLSAYGHWGSCTSGTVRDGIAAAHKGLPSIAFVTEDFWPQGDFVAKAQGMPDVPRVKLPHPVAGTGKQAMAAVANDILQEIIAKLSNNME